MPGDGMSVADVLALSRTNRDGDYGFGGGLGFIWLIVIILFVLAFSGGNGFGGWGGNNAGNNLQLSNLERDVLNGNCATQKEVLESRYTTQLGFQAIQAQIAECCCDIKNTVHAEGEATRAQQTALEIQDLRDRLGVANNALTVQTITSGIIDTVRPFPQPAYITCSPYESTYGLNRYGNYPYGNYGNWGNYGCCGTI